MITLYNVDSWLSSWQDTLYTSLFLVILYVAGALIIRRSEGQVSELYRKLGVLMAITLLGTFIHTLITQPCLKALQNGDYEIVRGRVDEVLLPETRSDTMVRIGEHHFYVPRTGLSCGYKGTVNEIRNLIDGKQVQVFHWNGLILRIDTVP